MAIRRDGRFTRLYTLLGRGLFEGNPEGLCSEIAGIFWSNFADLLAKTDCSDKANDAETFVRRNKDPDRIPEYAALLATGEFKKRGDIRRKVSRGDWREFLDSSKMRDLGNVFQYFARLEGRGNTGEKPSCLDPLGEEEKAAFRPQAKAGALGFVFDGIKTL